jgi:hypothetical protein
VSAAPAVRGAGREDDPRVHGPDVIHVDMQLLSLIGQEVGQEDVGRLGQAQQQFVTLGGFHVEPDTALAPVGQLDHVGHAAERDEPRGHQAALRVSGLGVLHLDHVRAPLGQDRARHRHVCPGSDLEHANSAHDLDHRRLLIIDGLAHWPFHRYNVHLLSETRRASEGRTC